MNKIKLALLAFASSLPMVAHASVVTGPYVNIGGGYNLAQSQHGHFSPGTFADGTNSPAGSSSTFRHQNGFDGFGAVGYGFGNGFRVEVEGIYDYSEITHRTHTPVSGSTRGSDQGYGGFINGIYDIDLQRNFGINSPITPYVGIGAGYMWQHYNPTDTHFSNGSVSRLGGTNGGFAYQGIVGASFDTGVPGLTVNADYRMIGQTFSDGAYQMTGYNGSGSHRGNAGGFGDRFNHQFNLSLRYAFDTAPPPPPCPGLPFLSPHAEPARTYLVFFDWDSAALTGRAREIVASAAGATTHVQTTRIEVNGYTDNSAIHSGVRGEKYNMNLSIRRANSVKSELIKDGVPSSAIDIHGYGETHPLVPTGPNTREPQNRRVEIILK